MELIRLKNAAVEVEPKVLEKLPRSPVGFCNRFAISFEMQNAIEELVEVILVVWCDNSSIRQSYFDLNTGEHVADEVI